MRASFRLSVLAALSAASCIACAATAPVADKSAQPSKPSADVLLAKGDAKQAVSAFEQSLVANPDDDLARFGLAQALYEVRAYGKAWDIAARHPKLFSPVLRAELRHRAAVELLREAETLAGAEQAGQLLKSVSLMEANGPQGYLTPERASDLIVAYQAAGFHEKAVALYEALEARKTDTAKVSAWALLPAAQSYVEVGQLDRARDILVGVLAGNPADVRATYALVFVNSDLHRFDDARQLLARLAAVLQSRNDPELRYARLLSARLELWAGHRGTARRLATELANREPAYVPAQHLLADIDRDAGSRTRALDRLQALAERDMSNLDARVSIAQLEANSPSEARDALAALRTEFVEAPAVLRAEREVSTQAAGRLELSSRSTHDNGSSGRENKARVEGPTFGPWDIRPYAEVRQSQGQLTTGTTERISYGAGIQVSTSSFGSFEVGVSSVPRDGAGLNLAWLGAPTDYVRLRARYLSADAEVPTRGWLAGVTASSFSIGGAVRTDTLDAGLDFKQQSLSDDNTRRSLSGSISGRFADWGNYQPDWVLRAGLESASSTNVAYFSPSRSSWTDVQIGVGVPKVQLGALFVKLHPTVSVGTFKQSGYGLLPTASAELGSSIDLTSNLSMGLTLGTVRRPYDGQYITEKHGNLTFSARLQ